LNSLGKLLVAAGMPQAAAMFKEVESCAAEKSAKAQGLYNAYLVQLQRKATWKDALSSLIQAINLDPERIAPFPLNVYEPERILGMDSFSVTFQCRQKAGDLVVVKALMTD